MAGYPAVLFIARLVFLKNLSLQSRCCLDNVDIHLV